MCDPDFDVDFVSDIAPDVLGVLAADCFFERLDDLFCPLDPTIARVRCGHSFKQTIDLLHEFGMSSDDIDDVLAVLKSRGGCCDCEVLFNVAEESRLKAEYWNARAAELIANKDSPNQL